MQTNAIWRRWLRLGLLMLLLSGAMVLNRPVTADPEAAAPSPLNPDLGWTPALPGTRLSTSSILGAGSARIAATQDDSRLMVTFNNWITGRNDRDPYFVVSFDNGGTWTTPAPIFVSSGIDSYNVELTFDPAGTAHAVWIELDVNSVPRTTTLVYSQKPVAQPWTAPVAISALTNDASAPIMAAPQIVASGSSTLDVVWVEADQDTDQSPDVYHARSLNSGASWTNNGRVTPTIGMPTSNEPSLVVDPAGQLHLVWEESAGGVSTNINYVYSAGPQAGAVVTWANAAAPLVLNEVNSFPDPTKARIPRLNYFNGRLYVSYTWVIDVAPGDSLQFAYLATCSSNCTSLAGWQRNNISGIGLDVNTSDPFSLTTTMASNQQTPFVYFHGIDTSGPNENEQIWGVYECRSWSAQGRDIATDTTQRAIYPDIEAMDEWLHLVYEWVNTSGGNDHQIHYMHAPVECLRYSHLPIIMRQ